MTWTVGDPGVVELPSGRLVRGRGLRQDLPHPDFGLVLLGRPRHRPYPTRWVRWPDFRHPRDPADLRSGLVELLRRAAEEEVEISCGGGNGRTGTALACLAVLDGVPADEAVSWVRARYRPRAVETPAQRRLVTDWNGPLAGPREVRG